MFIKGQKVVCLDDKKRQGFTFSEPSPIRKGAIYTVECYYKSPYGMKIILVEIIEKVSDNPLETPGFFSDRFRPVVERKTDISIFEKLLLTKDESELIEG